MSFFDRAARLIALPVLLMLAACGGDPGPFSTRSADSAALVRPLADGGGIVVLGVDGAGAETGRALQQAMIDALADHDIPAASDGGNRRSRFLTGRAKVEPRPRDRVRVQLAWELADTAGRPLGSQGTVQEALRAAWESGDPALTKALASAAAPGIAAIIQDPVPRDAGGDKLPLHVYPVAGVAERDALALRRAMEGALRESGYAIAPELGENALIVAGSVALGPPSAGKRRIEVTWAVLDGAGRELGRLAQENMMPFGEGLPGLGAVAQDIAAAAAGGVVELLEKLPRGALGGARPGRG